MMKIFFVFVFLIFLVAGCKEKESANAKIIKENKGKEWSLYVQGDSNAIILPLETNEEALIGAFDKILMNDTNICILDRTKEKSISIFTTAGKFKTKIKKSGRGAGEYISPDDINLNKDSLLILDRANRKMLYFSLNGEFYKETFFESYRPVPFCVVDDSHLAFYVGMPGHSGKNSEVIVTDLQGKIINQYIPRPHLSVQEGRFYLPDYFVTNRNGVFFIPVFEDKIYRLEVDTIEAVFDFGFKDFMYSFGEIGSKPLLEHKRKYGYFNSFHMADDGTFVCSVNRGNTPVDICGNIYTQQLDTWEGDRSVCGVYKDYFITTISNPDQQQEGSLGNNRALLFVKGKRLLR